MKKQLFFSREGVKYVVLTMIVAFLTMLAACGEEDTDVEAADDGDVEDELIAVEQLTNWYAQAEQGGQFAAHMMGFYEENGLDMTIQAGGGGVSNTQLVASGQVDFGMGSSDEILLAREEGIPLVAIAGIFQQSPQALMFHKGQDIEYFTDLNGRDVYISPGFIDGHVHYNDPGRESWEGFSTGTAAAAAGGITTIIDMPLNSHPSVTSSFELNRKRRAVFGKAYVDYGFWGGVTSENCRNQKVLLEQVETGVIGLKGFMSDSGIVDFPYLRREDLHEVMAFCGETKTLLALHAESQETLENYAPLQNKSRQSFLSSRPEEAELSAIEQIIENALHYHTPVHVVHVSSPTGIKMLHEAKHAGADITIETCPHYLLFDEDDFIREGPVLKCAPPLRNKKKVEQLWELLADGLIDIIGSDHSPCPPHMKQSGMSDIRKAWGGIQGVQFGHKLLLSESRKRGIPLSTVIPLMTENPASRFLPYDIQGKIVPGNLANLSIYHLEEETIHQSDILFKHKASPYVGMKTTGGFTKVMLHGETVYQKVDGVTYPLGKELTYEAK